MPSSLICVSIIFRHSAKPIANTKSVISEFLNTYVRADARPLDITSLDTALSGAEQDIFINRQQLLVSANEELLDNDIDPRVPLNVHFHGEGNVIFLITC